MREKITFAIVITAIIFLSTNKKAQKSIVKNEKTEIAINNCEAIISEQLNIFWGDLTDFQSNYFPDENMHDYKWNYDFEQSEISVLKNRIPYLNIDFVHVGSINVHEKTWTWSWLNTQKEEEPKLQEVKAFGAKNDCEKLINATWSGTEKEAWKMVAISNYILKGKGGARHYTKTEYNYVVFTKIQKID